MLWVVLCVCVWLGASLYRALTVSFCSKVFLFAIFGVWYCSHSRARKLECCSPTDSDAAARFVSTAYSTGCHWNDVGLRRHCIRQKSVGMSLQLCWCVCFSVIYLKKKGLRHGSFSTISHRVRFCETLAPAENAFTKPTAVVTLFPLQRGNKRRRRRTTVSVQ